MTTAPKSSMTVRITSHEVVEVMVRYNCGCGFQTEELVEAVKHTHQLGHKMEMRGAVVPHNSQMTHAQTTRGGGVCLER